MNDPMGMSLARAATTIDSSLRTGLETGTPDDTFQRAGHHLRSILSIRVPRPERDPLGVAALCHAVLAVRDVGQAHLLSDAVRDGISYALDRMQDPASGLFTLAHGRHSAVSAESIRMTRLAVETLDALDRKSLYPFAVVREWLEGGPDIAWLAGSAEAGPESMELLAHALQLLVHAAERHFDDDLHARVHGLLDRLAEVQDSGTGLWGTSRVRVTDRIVASARFAALFDHVQRPVQRVSRIADSVLSAWTERHGVSVPPEMHCAAATLLALRLRAGPASDVRDRLLTCFAMLSSELETVASGQDEVPGDDFLRSTWHRISAAKTVARLLAVDAKACAGSHWAPANHSEFESAELVPTRAPGLTRFWIREIPRLDERVASPPQAPAVAVVIPCYNLGIYLHEALSSVAGQTLQDLEVVVVDDGSTHTKTRIILDHWERRGLTVIRQANGGVAAARNNGIRATKAPFLCCLDPDDRITPDFLERAHSVLIRKHDVGFVSGHTRIFDERDDVIRPDRCDLPDMYVFNAAVEPSVFRRTTWQELGGFWGGFSTPGIEDWDLWLRILKSGLRAELIPDIVWEYRIRPGQMSNAMYEPERWATLTNELAARNENTIGSHMADVLSGHHRAWARLHGWATQLERGVTFWRNQTEAWEATVMERDATIEEMRLWIAELENAKAWWQDQSESWRRLAAGKKA
jgi:hypothetical protein